jgi:hypothetical protein
MPFDETEMYPLLIPHDETVSSPVEVTFFCLHGRERFARGANNPPDMFVFDKFAVD